jgi:hypothetical protein
MYDENEVFLHANMARREIKRMAASADYDSGDFRACVDILRDGIKTLANDLEFGKLEKILGWCRTLLEHSDDKGRWHTHKLASDDIIYFAQTFPTEPGFLLNDLSPDLRKNWVLVNSVVRSDFYGREGTSLDFYEMAIQLATFNDRESWLKLILSNPPEKERETLKVAMASLSFFEPTYLQQHRESFKDLSLIIQNHYRPTDFGWLAGKKKIDSDALFTALQTLDCSKTIQSILKVCWLEFKEPFTLQRTMKAYDYVPDDEYRKHLAQSAHAGESKDGQAPHIATSYFLHDLSIPDEYFQTRVIISMESIQEILALNGAETPYGVFNYLPHKIGNFLDDMIQKHANEKGAKLEAVLDSFRAAIPEKQLRLSNFYKGHLLSDALGL